MQFKIPSRVLITIATCGLFFLYAGTGADVVEENVVLYVKSNIKLRQEPSAKSTQVSCSTMSTGCAGGECGGTTTIAEARVVLHSPRRTAKREKISGTTGYWYQLGEDCNAWVFGGFTEELYNEKKKVAKYSLSALQPGVQSGEAIAACAKLGMKLANLAQLMDAKKTGRIQISGEEGQQVWYLQTKNDYAMVNLEAGNTLVGGSHGTPVPFYCAK